MLLIFRCYFHCSAFDLSYQNACRCNYVRYIWNHFYAYRRVIVAIYVSNLMYLPVTQTEVSVIRTDPDSDKLHSPLIYTTTELWRVCACFIGCRRVSCYNKWPCLEQSAVWEHQELKCIRADQTVQAQVPSPGNENALSLINTSTILALQKESTRQAFAFLLASRNTFF